VLLILAALRYRQNVSKKVRPQVPVPVMFTMQGWDPSTQRARDWLAGRLRETYPLFAGKQGAGTARGMLDNGRIAVILDGLDEIPENLRPAVLRALSQQATFRLVLLTRSAEMAGATAQALLQGAAAIELQDTQQTADFNYDVRGAGRPTRLRGGGFPSGTAGDFQPTVTDPVRRCMASPSMTSRKLSRSEITVMVLLAWVMPTWIFWVATMMPPRLDTCRCTGTPAGGQRGGADQPPCSRCRWVGGMRQGWLRHRVPSWVITCISWPSRRMRARCPASGEPAQVCGRTRERDWNSSLGVILRHCRESRSTLPCTDPSRAPVAGPSECEHAHKW